MAQGFFTSLRDAETMLLEPVWPNGRNPDAPKDGGHFAIPGHLKRPISVSATEARFLSNLVALRDCSTVLEIGTGFGYSATWLAMGLSLCSKPNRVYTVDNFSEGTAGSRGLEIAQELWHKTGVTNLITVVEGTSPNAVRDLPDVEAGVVFIDGDHYGDQPLLDYRASSERLSSNGCIVFHDADDRYDVHKAVHQATSDGFQCIELIMSCHPVVAVRAESDVSLVNLAGSLGSRGLSVVPSLKG